MNPFDIKNTVCYFININSFSFNNNKDSKLEKKKNINGSPLFSMYIYMFQTHFR